VPWLAYAWILARSQAGVEAAEAGMQWWRNEGGKAGSLDHRRPVKNRRMMRLLLASIELIEQGVGSCWSLPPVST